MRKLLFISLLFGIILNSFSQVINLSPDSTLYKLHLLPGTAAAPVFDSVDLERYLVQSTFLLDNGVVVALVDTITTDTLRVYITGSDQPTPVTSMDSVSLDTSFQIGWGGVQFDSIVLVGGEVFWYSGGRGFDISKVIYTTPGAPATLTISSPDSDTLTYTVSDFPILTNLTDADSCMVRWDTTAIPTISSGELVYRGDTTIAETDFFIDMADSLKVYVSAFAKNDTGTAIGAWSVAKVDSVWIDSTGEGGYVAQYQTVYNYFDDTPADSTATIDNQFVKTLVDSSVWAKLRLVQVYASHSDANDGNDALFNWVNPGTDDGDTVRAPVFTTYEGWLPNAFSKNYVNSHYNPSTDGGAVATQDDMSFGLYVHDNVGNSGDGLGGTDGTNQIKLDPYNGTNTLWNINDGSQDFAANPGSSNIGFYIVNRTASNAREAFRNNTSLASDAQASTGLPNIEVWVGNWNNNGSEPTFAYQCTFSLFFVGSSLTATDIRVITNAFEVRMDALGTGIIP